MDIDNDLPGLNDHVIQPLDEVLTDTPPSLEKDLEQSTSYITTESSELPEPKEFSYAEALQATKRKSYDLKSMEHNQNPTFNWTLEPWVPPSAARLKSISRAQRLAVLTYANPQPTFNKTNAYTRFYEIKYPIDIDIRSNINIVKTMKEITQELKLLA